MRVLKIIPDFRDKIPPLTDAEFDQLRENILADGEVYEPIVVWKDIIIDGHNRWKIIQEHPEIPYKIKDVDFPDEYAAFEWMYKKQLGRRNLTDEQRTYMIGKMYEARRQSHGGQIRGSGQNDASVRTRTIIAKELGIGSRTVDRAAAFQKGVDTLKEISPEAATMVLDGKGKVTKGLVCEIPKMTPDQRIEAVEKITGKKAIADAPEETTSRKDSKAGYTREKRQARKLLEEAYAPMLEANTESTYDINDLVEEITANGEAYVRSLQSTLEQRSSVLDDEEAREIVRMAIDDIIALVKKARAAI